MAWWPCGLLACCVHAYSSIGTVPPTRFVTCRVAPSTSVATHAILTNQIIITKSHGRPPPRPPHPCRYRAENIPLDIFFNGTITGDFLFPLETTQAAAQHEYPWQVGGLMAGKPARCAVVPQGPTII